MEDGNIQFRRFKEYCVGKTLVVCASGPTFNNYTPIENAMHLCVNQTALKIQPDFFFCQDYAHTTNIDYLLSIKSKVKSFIGWSGKFRSSPEYAKEKVLVEHRIPTTVAEKMNAITYYVDRYKTKFVKNISAEDRMLDGGSVIFAAMQFALYTKPDKIILVGCDCSSGKFNNDNGSKAKLDTNKTIELWKRLKQFADEKYPTVKIYSLNPVGLKGLFDEYKI